VVNGGESKHHLIKMSLSWWCGGAYWIYLALIRDQWLCSCKCCKDSVCAVVSAVKTSACAVVSAVNTVCVLL
jgi:hypothetical protein